MDAMLLFPALLGLMVAALTGLGYALYRLANTASSQFTLPPTHMQLCEGCGARLVDGVSHCPLCGAARETLAEVSTLPRQDAQDANARLSFP